MIRLLLLLLLAGSCQTAQPQKAFLTPEEVKSIPKPECYSFLDLYMKVEKKEALETKMMGNYMGFWFTFFGDGEAVLLTFASPGQDWTREKTFDKHKFLGYCEHSKNGKYFLVYELRAKQPGV